jgi:polar amino acid transport system substrate-binding protein
MSAFYQHAMKATVLFVFVLLLFFVVVKTADAETNNQLVFTSAEWPPVIYQDEKGKMSGLYADLLYEVFINRLGLNFQYKQVPWRRAQREVREGIADFLIAIPDAERLQYAVSSKRPFFKLYLNVYTYENHPRIQEIQGIKTVGDIKRLGLTTVSNMGNGWQKANVEAMGIPTFYALTEEEACLFLARKRADIMIDAVVPTNHIIRKMGIADELVMTAASFGPINLHLLMSKESKYLPFMDRIDKAFAELEAEGIVEKLLERYNSLP